MINIWTLRPKIDDNNRMDDFIEKDIIAVGWSKLSNLKNKNKDEISEEFYQNYNQSGQKASLAIGVIDRFVNEFNFGDLVFVPDDDVVYIAEIISSYNYDDSNNISPHTRKVKWIKRSIPKAKLPEKLQDGLKSRMSLYSLTKYYDLIAYWLNTNAESMEDRLLNYSDKFKALIGLEAIKYVGPSTQGHYDVVELSLREFMTEDYKEIVENIISISKELFLELNDLDSFEEFIRLLNYNNLSKSILKKRIELSNKYKERLLKILDVNELRKMDPAEVDDKEYEIYKIDKEIDDNYSSLNIKDKIYSKVKKEIESVLNKKEKDILNNNLNSIMNIDPELIEFFKRKGSDADFNRLKKFDHKLSTILTTIISFDMD